MYIHVGNVFEHVGNVFEHVHVQYVHDKHETILQYPNISELCTYMYVCTSFSLTHAV